MEKKRAMKKDKGLLIKQIKKQDKCLQTVTEWLSKIIDFSRLPVYKRFNITNDLTLMTDLHEIENTPARHRWDTHEVQLSNNLIKS